MFATHDCGMHVDVDVDVVGKVEKHGRILLGGDFRNVRVVRKPYTGLVVELYHNELVTYRCIQLRGELHCFVD